MPIPNINEWWDTLTDEEQEEILNPVGDTGDTGDTGEPPLLHANLETRVSNETGFSDTDIAAWQAFLADRAYKSWIQSGAHLNVEQKKILGVDPERLQKADALFAEADANREQVAMSELAAEQEATKEETGGEGVLLSDLLREAKGKTAPTPTPTPTPASDTPPTGPRILPPSQVTGAPHVEEEPPKKTYTKSFAKVPRK